MLRKGGMRKTKTDLRSPACPPHLSLAPLTHSLNCVLWHRMRSIRKGAGAGKSQETRGSDPTISPPSIWRRGTTVSSSHLHCRMIQGDANTSFLTVGAPDRGGLFGHHSQDWGSLKHSCVAADGLTQLAFRPSSCFPVST